MPTFRRCYAYKTLLLVSEGLSLRFVVRRMGSLCCVLLLVFFYMVVELTVNRELMLIWADIRSYGMWRYIGTVGRALVAEW